MKILIILGVLIIGLFFFDLVTCKSEELNGIVLDKHYKQKENDSYHTYGTDGKMHYTTRSSPEKFLLICRLNEKEVVTTESDASIYYSKKVNDKCIIEITKGGISGLTYSINTIK